MKREVLKKIEKIVGREHLATAAEDLACYSFDGTGLSFPPHAVAFPDSPEQIAAILQLANIHKFPVVPRGAGSGMTGGALPVEGGLVLVTNRMNRILEIDAVNMIAVVEPGVITGELQNELKKQRLMYPPDPASLKFCSIGGNAAECAGGPSAVKYGVTRDYIIGLEVVLPSGEIMKTGVRTEKGVVGYDLTHLFIGSEGTLGIFTKLILRLLPLPESKETFLLTFTSLTEATGLVAELLASGLMPCTLEYMDRTAISIVHDRLTNPLPEDTAALLLVEIDGGSSEVARQSEQLDAFLRNHHVTFKQAGNEAEKDELWQARRSISPTSFSLRPHKISEDVVVPRSRIPDLVDFTTNLSTSQDLIILTFGHAGDGNIHVNIMVNKNNKEELSRGLEAKKQLFAFVVDVGGTLSGEHGIGITKSEFLPLEIDPTALTLMKRLKQLFDPENILNPGKIFPKTPADP
ncbi:MAG: FAD-binding protein [Desulfobulbaceae bacterium]|nr:FAD-binding protein [Desulfobulbaceae bacterium]